MTYLPKMLIEEVVRDSRYDPLVVDFDGVKRQAILNYILGRSIVTEVTDGKYNVAIVVVDNCNSVEVIKSLELPNYPVACGRFMNWWEKDHKKYFDISKTNWEGMKYSERASIEAALQLELWVKDEFARNFASIYYPEVYDKWWWANVNNRRLTLIKVNKYWWKFLNNLDEFPELIKVIK